MSSARDTTSDSECLRQSDGEYVSPQSSGCPLSSVLENINKASSEPSPAPPPSMPDPLFEALCSFFPRLIRQYEDAMGQLKAKATTCSKHVHASEAMFEFLKKIHFDDERVGVGSEEVGRRGGFANPLREARASGSDIKSSRTEIRYKVLIQCSQAVACAVIKAFGNCERLLQHLKKSAEFHSLTRHGRHSRNRKQKRREE